ncbi:DUF115 domain-containing protein [Candidatus Heimdallarchaeota archaeon]|nr:MAG: DUF115 domain-containing protein [Candidatus Heimdallarchaeota archaeon]
MIFETSESLFKDLEKKVFTKEVWLNHWYPRICEYLEINPEEDRTALEKTLKVVKSVYPSYGLKQLLGGKRTIAIAPGVNLEDEIDFYLNKIKSNDDILISADGATTYLNALGIIPHIIVTDFDGNISDQLLAQQKGSILLIHVHGDNYPTLKNHTKSILDGKFILTTQTNPLIGSHNFFGFTDGDRIVCLASLMNAKEIKLIGYDFGSSIGKYSKNFDMDKYHKSRKMKKFTIGKSIINWCYNSSQKISFLSDA